MSVFTGSAELGMDLAKKLAPRFGFKGVTSMRDFLKLQTEERAGKAGFQEVAKVYDKDGRVLDAPQPMAPSAVPPKAEPTKFGNQPGDSKPTLETSATSKPTGQQAAKPESEKPQATQPEANANGKAKPEKQASGQTEKQNNAAASNQEPAPKGRSVFKRLRDWRDQRDAELLKQKPLIQQRQEAAELRRQINSQRLRPLKAIYGTKLGKALTWGSAAMFFFSGGATMPLAAIGAIGHILGATGPLAGLAGLAGGAFGALAMDPVKQAAQGVEKTNNKNAYSATEGQWADQIAAANQNGQPQVQAARQQSGPEMG